MVEINFTCTWDSGDPTGHRTPLLSQSEEMTLTIARPRKLFMERDVWEKKNSMAILNYYA
jgi:hypothetical protein